MKTKFFCFHAHFHQPPAFDPWTLLPGREKSASPHENRIQKSMHECYLPNAFLALESDSGETERFVNNYSMISFDFSPVLLDRIEENHSLLREALLRADKESAANFGRPSAIAQVYNHAIMPLASARDKTTFVRWGLERFRKFFLRESEGVWLPETAVDEETLETLCLCGLKYTVLSRRQARAFRKIGLEKWEPANEISFDALAPLRWFSRRQSGKFIDVFFFDDKLSTSEMSKTDVFYNSILAGFSKDISHELLSAAADGENCGHRSGGGKALAALLLKIRKEKNFNLANYSSFLENNPPQCEAGIAFPSSRSCPHGAEKWRGDCACHAPQGRPWREPLRKTLDWLAQKTGEIFLREGGEFFRSPQKALDDYVSSTGEGPAAVREFLADHSPSPLAPANAKKALKLLEMRKNAALALDSDAWLSRDISLAPALDSVRFALRSADLAEIFGENLLDEFIERLPGGEAGIRETAQKIYAQKSDKPLEAAKFAFLLRMDFTPPLLKHGRYRHKVIEEKKTSAGRMEFYLVNVKTTDTLDWGEYMVAAGPGGGAPEFHVLSSDTEKFRRFAETAERDFESFRKGFKAGEIFVFSLSSFPEEYRRIHHLLSREHPENEPARALSKWLHHLKHFSAELILTGGLLENLKECRLKRINSSEILFRDEILKAVVSQFRFMLENLDPGISKLRGWLEYLQSDPLQGYFLETQSVLKKWEETYSPDNLEPGFRRSLAEISSSLRVKLHGNRKNKTSNKR